jgi:hypothetical protein
MWRTTSSHLHVVSAGNSQRNSPAVSECQEELNNAVILSRTTRPSPETSPSAPHETPNIQYQYTGREWRPFHVRPRWRMNWSSILLPDRSLRCQRVKVARRRGGVNLRHIINTTSLRTPHITEHFSSRRTQNTSSNASISSINDASTRRKSPSEPHETPNMQYQYARREWRPFHVRPWMEDGLRHSIFLPDNSLRYRKLKSTRRRGGVDGKEMAHHTENTLQEVTILNHAIATNTTHSSEPIFYTRHTLPLTQPADIAARHRREGRRGDASGCQ